MKTVLPFFFLAALVSGRSTGEGNKIGCPSGWTSMGAKCVRFSSSDKGTWNHAVDTCQGYGGELLAWRDETEWRIAQLFFAEMQVVGVAREAWAGANHDGGDWTWGNSGDLVPMEYGWHRDEPNLVGKSCSVFTFHDGGCDEDCIGMKDEPCDMYYPFICQKPME